MKLHFSFDFWNTVGEFNPAFSRARVGCLAKNMNVPEDVAKAHYIAVKRYVDGEAERTGRAFHSVDVFHQTLKRADPKASIADAQRVHDEVQILALENPPIIRADTTASIRHAHAMGVSISITSNTNFVNGNTLAEVMRQTGIPLDFALYSDQLPCAKPSPHIFAMVRAKVGSDAEIIHFGDHPICDVEGANNAGMTGVLVTYPTLADTITSTVNQLVIGRKFA